jgi:hypothetical protein
MGIRAKPKKGREMPSPVLPWGIAAFLLRSRSLALLAWCGVLAVCLCSVVLTTRADDPKPTPANTIHVVLSEPVPPQKFQLPVKFTVVDVVDRAGNPQPMLVTSGHGAIFVDRLPADIVRDALESSLKSADLLATDASSADVTLGVYLFHFGLAAGSGGDYFGKVELAVTVKNPKTGKSQQVSASGTSISRIAVLKKNAMKNLEENLTSALGDALRNLLRGQALRDAVTKTMAEASTGN